MEFTFQLTEADYLTASKVKTRPTGTRRTSTMQDFVALLTLATTWGVLLAGMLLERFLDRTFAFRSKGLHPHHAAPGTDRILLQSLIPGLVLGWLVLIIMRVTANILTRRHLGSQLRTNPSLCAETTATFTPEFVSFSSSSGTYRVSWGLCDTWAERDEIVVLGMRNGILTPVKISSLSDAQRNELRSILTAALRSSLLPS